MAGSRKYSSIFSRGSLGKRTGSDDETLPSAARVPGPRRETAGSRFRRRGGAGGGRSRPLVGLFVRAITNPRAVLLGVLVFTATPALYFFRRTVHRQEENRRLTEPQRLAADLDAEGRQSEPEPPWQPPVLPPEVFREVPSEECAPSELLEKTVDPSDYEFGCDEIEVRSQALRVAVLLPTKSCCLSAIAQNVRRLYLLYRKIAKEMHGDDDAPSVECFTSTLHHMVMHELFHIYHTRRVFSRFRFCQ